MSPALVLYCDQLWRVCKANGAGCVVDVTARTAAWVELDGC